MTSAQWSYELDGRLFAARHDGANLEKSRVPGPFIDPQKGGVSQFVDWYANAMRAELQAQEIADVA